VVALFAGAALGVALDHLVRWGGLALTSAIVAGVLAYAWRVEAAGVREASVPASAV
jgi:hypothetical protein